VHNCEFGIPANCNRCSSRAPKSSPLTPGYCTLCLHSNRLFTIDRLRTWPHLTSTWLLVRHLLQRDEAQRLLSTLHTRCSFFEALLVSVSTMHLCSWAVCGLVYSSISHHHLTEMVARSNLLLRPLPGLDSISVAHVPIVQATSAEISSCTTNSSIMLAIVQQMFERNCPEIDLLCPTFSLQNVQ